MELDRIHLGDCLSWLKTLPDASVDAVITDPPYSSGGMMRSDRTAKPSSKYVQTATIRSYAEFSGDNRDARSWAYWCHLWMSECLRIVKASGYFLCFVDWRMLPTATDAIQAAGFVWRGIVAWDKGDGARAPHKGYFRHQCEYVVWGTRGVSKIAEHGGPWPGSYRVAVKAAEKLHMTGKPIELMKKLVEIVPSNGIILDPFAGSGTTLLAAKLSGRHYLGCELSPEYHRIAEDRLQTSFALVKHGEQAGGLFASKEATA